MSYFKKAKSSSLRSNFRSHTRRHAAHHHQVASNRPVRQVRLKLGSNPSLSHVFLDSEFHILFSCISP
jgi:hypothetical protein